MDLSSLKGRGATVGLIAYVERVVLEEDATVSETGQ